MGRVGHHDSRRLRQVLASEAGDAVRADRRCHPCSRGTAPQGIALSTDPERVGILEDVRDGRSQILGGDRSALSGPVFQDEGIVSLAADLDGIRKAFVDGADIGKPASGRDDRKGCSRLVRERRTTRYAPSSDPPASAPRCRSRRRRFCPCPRHRSCGSTIPPPSRDGHGCGTAGASRCRPAACSRHTCDHPRAISADRTLRMPDGSGCPGCCCWRTEEPRWLRPSPALCSHRACHAPRRPRSLSPPRRSTPGTGRAPWWRTAMRGCPFAIYPIAC